MKEKLEREQKIDDTIQPFAGAPGAGTPGGTSNYLEEFPAEANNDTTTYDNKNAIWNSGTKNEGYRTISFAGDDRGIQLRASTTDPNPTSQPGVPGHVTSTNIYARVKRSPQAGYLPWYEIYHKGNLNPSNYALKTSVAAKADKTYVDSALASKATISDLSTKVEKTYVDNALVNKADTTAVNAKADKSYVDENLKLKANYTSVANQFTDIQNHINALYTNINNINDRISNLH